MPASVEPAFDHPADLYNARDVLTGVQHFSDVDESQLAAFRDTGILVIESAFTLAERDAGLQGLLDLIDGKNPEFKGLQFEPVVADRASEFTSEQRQDAVRKLMGFCDFDARLKAMSHHPSLLALVGKLIGAAPEMFQDMALLKPPRIGREKPWHQDLAYFDVDAQSTPVVGCWIALDEATAGNGCMHVIPGSHKAGPQPHFAKRDWQLCDAQMQGRPCAVVPLKPGGLMLFDGLIQHGTPTNHSTSRRRALQFHYRPAGTKLTPPEVRLQVWGAEGKNVDC